MTKTVTIPLGFFADLVDWVNSGSDLEWWLKSWHTEGEDPETIAHAYRLDVAITTYGVKGIEGVAQLPWDDLEHEIWSRPAELPLAPQTFSGFCDYVMHFYGPNGTYPMGATREQVEGAVKYRLQILEKRCEDFVGDSDEREAVRDILIATYGLTFPEQESANA